MTTYFSEKTIEEYPVLRYIRTHQCPVQKNTAPQEPYTTEEKQFIDRQIKTILGQDMQLDDPGMIESKPSAKSSSTPFNFFQH